MKVLITGGSGYLGQFLVDRLCNGHSVAYTYLTHQVPHPHGVSAFQADLATGVGLVDAVLAFQPAVVINCAALSQPAVCERDYEACRALNVPQKLIGALQQLNRAAAAAGAPDTLLVHLSTDQVYDGSRSWWAEADPTEPVNAYGRSKLEAELTLQQLYPGRFVVLRSSLIYGPEPPLAPVGRPLFVQFVQQVLQEGKESPFFVDEFRCAIYVDDIVAIIEHIIKQYSKVAAAAAAAAAQSSAAGDAAGCWLAGLPHSCYNMGGPERLSREDMALAVARQCQLETSTIKQARSADVQRGYTSPPDISMAMDRLLQDMPNVQLTPFSEALKHIFPAPEKP